jgi:hypothetical protein
MEWDNYDMDSTVRVPVTAAVFTVATIILSGCIAYDAASTVVGAGTTAVGTGISVVSGTGRLMLAPITSSEDEEKAK